MIDDKARKIIELTAQFEGAGSYEAWNPNDVGKGISIGLIQFNQKVGSMPDLLKKWYKADPVKFNSVFGPFAQSLLEQDYVKKTSMSDDEWKRRFVVAMTYKPFQACQLQLAYDGYYVPAETACTGAGLKSERWLSLMFDASVQYGPGGARRKLAESKLDMAKFCLLCDGDDKSGRRHKLSRNEYLSD